MTSRKLSARARGNQRRRGGDTAGRQRLKYENRSTKGDGNYTTTRDFIGWEVLRVRAGTWWDELLGASDDRRNQKGDTTEGGWARYQLSTKLFGKRLSKSRGLG